MQTLNYTQTIVIQLNKCIAWSRQNYLPLNINKCSSITFSHLDNVITYNYKIDNCSIIRITSIRNVGIIIEYNLLFSLHINTLVKKAFKISEFINRNTINFKNIILFSCQTTS